MTLRLFALALATIVAAAVPAHALAHHTAPHDCIPCRESVAAELAGRQPSDLAPTQAADRLPRLDAEHAPDAPALAGSRARAPPVRSAVDSY